MNAFDLPATCSLVEIAEPKILTKNLPAISIKHSNTQSLKLSKNVSTVKHTDSMNAVCSYTGIVIDISIPTIPNHVLEYASPLSIFSNVKGMIYAGDKYLDKLETQILAGIWITAYRHYDLLHTTNSTSAAMLNAMLRTAGKSVLIDSLCFIECLSMDKAEKCPRISLDYDAHKDSASLAPVIQEYTKTIREILYGNPKEYEETESFVGGAVYANTSIKKRKPIGLSDIEKAYEEQIASNKRTAKTILAEITNEMLLPVAFITLLKQAITGKNLSALNDSLRSKIVEKLENRNHPTVSKLAKIIADSKNPYDIFATVDKDLERVSDTLPATGKKMSLAEMLAAKKAAATNSTQVQTNNVDTSGSDF